jgi:rod shape-determining protein MreC
MAFGRGPGRLDLAYVPQFPDVLHGDRVVTSGLDGIFPRGFGLGSVISISETPDGVRTIHLEPELDLAGLEEVLVLLEPVPGEWLALPEPAEVG